MINWGDTNSLSQSSASFDLLIQETFRARIRSCLKRAVDLALVGPLLILALPLCAIIAFWVRTTSQGPVLFRQERIGYRGRPFTLLKFRTMTTGDDRAHRAYVSRWIRAGEGAAQADGCFKLIADPRVTRVGRILRRYSLDEIPQLLNVLFGEMSLVGPRPALPYEVAEYEPWQRERMAVRPGLTGLWQVSGRNRLSFDRMMKLDVLYVRTHSIAGDLGILFRTASVVLQGTGL